MNAIDDAALRAAFQGLAGRGTGECAEAERIWDAVTGRLPAEERRMLVAKLALEPASAEAWRLASELWREAQAAETARRGGAVRAWNRNIGLLAAAAAVLLLAVFATQPWRDRLSGPATFRAGEASSIRLLVADGAALSRARFALAWEPLAPDARHTLRVVTEDLTLAHVGRDVAGGEYVVPAALLEGLASGTVVLWSVEARRADGTVVSSATFRARLAD